MVAITNSHTSYTYGCFRHCTGTSLVISTYCSNGFFFINLTSADISFTNLFRRRSISFPSFQLPTKSMFVKDWEFCEKTIICFSLFSCNLHFACARIFSESLYYQTNFKYSAVHLFYAAMYLCFCLYKIAF